MGHYRMDGSTLEDVVPPGVLASPSGLELRNELLYVSDSTSGRIVAFLDDAAADSPEPPPSLALPDTVPSNCAVPWQLPPQDPLKPFRLSGHTRL